MKFVLIVGSGAVGKMTVGKALSEKTNLKLFHNHMMIEPVIELFGHYKADTVAKLRHVIFEDFFNSDQEGLIFTLMWAFDLQEDWDYVNQILDKYVVDRSDFYCVELVAPQEVRLKRNETSQRLEDKKSKRDIEFSKSLILREDEKYRFESYDGELPFENYVKIDNTHLSAEEVANMIKEKFNL